MSDDWNGDDNNSEGEVWEDIQDLEVLQYIDVLVDGRFDKERKDNLLHWRGSGNQRVIAVRESLWRRQIIIFPDIINNDSKCKR